MRSKAIETAAEYLPAVGYSRWKTVLCELERPWLPDIDSRRTGESIAPRSLTVSGTERGVELEMDLTVIDGSIAPLLQLVLSGRKVNSYFLCSEPKIRSHARGRGATVTFAVPHELFSESDGEIFDVFLRRPRDPWNAKRRVRTPSTLAQRCRTQESGMRRSTAICPFGLSDDRRKPRSTTRRWLQHWTRPQVS